jgi:hypothetical protein
MAKTANPDHCPKAEILTANPDQESGPSVDANGREWEDQSDLNKLGDEVTSR